MLVVVDGSDARRSWRRRQRRHIRTPHRYIRRSPGVATTKPADWAALVSRDRTPDAIGAGLDPSTDKRVAELGRQAGRRCRCWPTPWSSSPTGGARRAARLRPELSATEGVWSYLKHGLGNCAATGMDQFVTLVRTRLKRIQYRPNYSTDTSARPDSSSSHHDSDRATVTPQRTIGKTWTRQSSHCDTRRFLHRQPAYRHRR